MKVFYVHTLILHYYCTSCTTEMYVYKINKDHSILTPPVDYLLYI